jgi:hypothetical protein
VSRLARQTPLARLLAVALAAALLLGAAGCGGSNKPGYCADRTRLEDSIKGLTSLNPANGLSGVEAQLKTIQSDANALVASAKSDFPTETGAIRTSIDTLESSIRALPSSPSAAQIASLATDASSVVNAVRGFVDATKSKCG